MSYDSAEKKSSEECLESISSEQMQSSDVGIGMIFQCNFAFSYEIVSKTFTISIVLIHI